MCVKKGQAAKLSFAAIRNAATPKNPIQLVYFILFYFKLRIIVELIHV